MKKFTIVVICAALLVALLAMSVLVVGVRKTHAQVERPLSLLDCTTGGGCNSVWGWTPNGLTNYAGITTLYVPSFTGGSAHTLVHAIYTYDSTNHWSIWVGYCYGNSLTGTQPYYINGIPCNNNGEYYFNECDATLQGCIGTDLGAIPGADKGHTAEFGVVKYATNNYEVILDHENGATQVCPFSRTSEACKASNHNYDKMDAINLFNYDYLAFGQEVDQGKFDYTVNKYETTFQGAFSYECAFPTGTVVNGAQLNNYIAPSCVSNLGGDIAGANEAAEDAPVGNDIDSIN